MSLLFWMSLNTQSPVTCNPVFSSLSYHCLFHRCLCMCVCVSLISVFYHHSMYIQYNRYLFNISTQYTQRSRTLTHTQTKILLLLFFSSLLHIANHSFTSAHRDIIIIITKRERAREKTLPIRLKKRFRNRTITGWLVGSLFRICHCAFVRVCE